MKSIARLVCIALIFFIASCGGGTAGTSSTGTGNRTLEIQGALKESNEAPLGDALVTVAGTDQSTTTDSLGNFSMVADTEETFDLTVEKNAQAVLLDVPEVAAGATSVTVDATIDFANNSAVVTSLDGRVAVVGACATYAVTKGSSVNFVFPPSSPDQCNLEYIFKSNSPLGTANLDVVSSSCSGLSSSVNGSQTNGSYVTAFQILTTGPVKKSCQARIRATFAESKTQTFFILNLSRESNGASSTVQGTFRGTLKLAPRGSTKASQCARFTAKRQEVIFKIDGNQVSAELTTENLRLVGTLSNGRFNIETKLTEQDGTPSTVYLSATASGATGKADLELIYNSGMPPDNYCSRLYQGTLKKSS